MRNSNALRWVLAGVLAQAGGQAQPPAARDLTEISLEELMNIEVVSVSKKQQPLTQVPAAVYVITQEDLRRSGVTSIPEALRMVPGVQVARIDANKWAISIRGFNGRLANKVLVMIDGRRVQTPVSSGVYWDLEDVLLEDVERIEVVRGPGAVLWGSGAVNGVVNVITKHARATQGGLVTGGGGTEERAFWGLRHGGRAGGAYYRAYAKFFQRSAFLTATGRPAQDDWSALRGGFRLDWETSAQDALRVQGDVHRGNAHQEVAAFSLTPPFERNYIDHAHFDARNLLARWERASAERSGMALQFYYDDTCRAEAINAEQTRTFDAEFQQRRPLGESHDLQWGLAARLMSDYLPPGLLRSFEPERRRHHLFSAYIQEEMRLASGRLHLTLGAKFEHNQYTGLEVQPAVQALWTPHRRHTLWGALARAVRSPARYERDARINLAAFSGLGVVPEVLRVMGNPGFESEQVRAHELGYRFQAARRVSLDLAGFWSRYRGLLGAEASPLYLESNPPPTHLVVPLVFANKVGGSSYGAEATAVWNVTSRWKLAGGHSWLRLRLRSQALQPLPDETRAQGESPEHQAHVRSNLDLPRQFSLDAALYAVSALSASEGYLARPGVPAYARLDVRLGWKPTRNWDFSVGLQNLLDAAHPEFITPEAFVEPGNQVRRGVYARLTWTF